MSDTKTRGEIIHELLQRQGLVGAMLHDGETYEQVAAEYDAAARAELPADVEAFVESANKLLTWFIWHGTEETRKALTDACAIIRGQVAKIRTLEDGICIVSCSACNRSIVGVDQGLVACPWCKRDALQAELAGMRAKRQSVIDGMTRAIAAGGDANKAYYEACRERDALRDRLAKLEAAALPLLDAATNNNLPRFKHIDALRAVLESKGSNDGR